MKRRLRSMGRLLRLYATRQSVGTAMVMLIGGALALGVAYNRRSVVGALQEHPYFKVDRIEVRGAGALVSEEEVRAWLGLPAGQSLWRVEPRRVARRLEAHPMVRVATARRVFPHTLEIRLRERRPAAISVLDDLYYVDKRGSIFGPLADRHDRDFPVFTGLSDGGDGQRRWALRRALHLIRHASAWSGLTISELHLDAERGLILYPSEPPVPIVLGWREWKQRLGRAARAFDTWDGSRGHIVSVDVRYRDQVVLGLRGDIPIEVGAGSTEQVRT